MAGHTRRPGDQRVVRLDLPEQHRFRQRRLFIRFAVLLGEQHDVASGFCFLAAMAAKVPAGPPPMITMLGGLSTRGHPVQVTPAAPPACPRCSCRRRRSPPSATTGAAGTVFSRAPRLTRCARPTTRAVVMMRRSLQALPMSVAASAWPPGPATITTRSAAPTSSVRFRVNVSAVKKVACFHEPAASRRTTASAARHRAQRP